MIRMSALLRCCNNNKTAVVVEDCDGEIWEVDSARLEEGKIVLTLEQPPPHEGMDAK